MKTKCLGIIAEYNPFHNGHLYHLKQSKAITGADIVVAAMSGNFVQRGQMAVYDKWDRAETAVRSGVDLVVEIPTVFACNSAPVFASGAVEILESLGADWISFGSESGNIDDLKDFSREITERNNEIDEFIKTKVKEGLSYPRARREAIFHIMGEEKAALLDEPNNILAIEYLKNIKKAKAVTVRRRGPGYNDMEISGNMASATLIRSRIKNGDELDSLVPYESLKMIKNGEIPSEKILFSMICHKALTTSSDELDRVFAGGEGLGNKLKKIIRMAESYEDLAEKLKSKRYTRTRVDRFLMHVLLGIDGPESYSNYARILAFNERGSSYIKEIKKENISEIPIITNINKDVRDGDKIVSGIEKDVLAADLYNLASCRNLYANSEYVKKPRLIL